MTDERTERAVADWLTATASRPPDGRASAQAVLASLDRSVPSSSAVPHRARVRFAVPAAIAAGVAVVAALALVGLPDAGPSSDGRGLVGAAASPEPAIHWQSRTIDLRADDVVLRIGDEEWRPEQGDIVIDAHDGTGQLALYPRWTDGERTFWLYLEFGRDADGWRLDPPWLWFDGVRADGFVRPPASEGVSMYSEIRGVPEIEIHGGFVDLTGPPIGRPLDQTYDGDWSGHGVVRRPACTEAGWEDLDVALTFTNLRLSVNDWRPSGIDELVDDMFHRGSMLGELFDGRLEPPGYIELDCSTGITAG